MAEPTYSEECRLCKKRHQYDEFPMGTRVRATNDRRGIRVTLRGDVGVVMGQSDVNRYSQLVYLVDFDDRTSGIMAPCDLEKI